MSESTLRDVTLELLQKRPRTVLFRDISKDTSIPETWLKSFNRGKTTHPSVAYVQKLYEHLTQTKLVF